MHPGPLRADVDNHLAELERAALTHAKARVRRKQDERTGAERDDCAG